MKENSNRLRCLRFFLALVLIYAYFLPDVGGAQTPYYEGKTVTILRVDHRAVTGPCRLKP